MLAWLSRIIESNSATAADLRMQQCGQIERTSSCRADYFQPDSFLDTMRLQVMHGSEALVADSPVPKPLGCGALPGYAET